MLQIPEITFTKEDFKAEAKEILINLNTQLWLNREIENHISSHRRILPTINVKSPSGTTASFSYPRFEGADIVYTGKRCNLRLKFI